MESDRKQQKPRGRETGKQDKVPAVNIIFSKIYSEYYIFHSHCIGLKSK